MSEKTSIIIPSRNEAYIRQTVEDVLKKATGSIEVIVAYDGEPYTELPNDPRVIVLARKQEGLKACINAAAKVATGKYIFKTDAHCAYSEGFDEVLQSEHQPYDVTVPRLYILRPETWEFQDSRFYDHFYLCCPVNDPRGYRFQAGGHWPQRTKERLNINPDETMQFHGSAWMVTRDYFWNCLGGMSSDKEYFGLEPPELGLKTFLGPWGGSVITQKRAWGAHTHKGKERPRGYHLGSAWILESYVRNANFWMRNRWKDRAHDLAWLIEKFSPPGWPADWQALQSQYEASPAGIAALARLDAVEKGS